MKTKKIEGEEEEQVPRETAVDNAGPVKTEKKTEPALPPLKNKTVQSGNTNGSLDISDNESHTSFSSGYTWNW